MANAPYQVVPIRGARAGGLLRRVLVVVAREGGRDEAEHDDHDDDPVVVARTGPFIRLAASGRADPAYPFSCCAFSHGGNATKEFDLENVEKTRVGAKGLEPSLEAV